MSVFFTRRGVMEKITPTSVTIAGTGNASYCYVTINDTKYSTAANDIEVQPGDIITFGVYGTDSSNYGEVTIDGVQVLKVTDEITRTYEWTVPKGTKTISISLSYTSFSSRRNGKIAVTTA